MGLWFDETYGELTRFGVRVSRSLYHGQSEYQRVDVFETEVLGRVLALDGTFQTSVADEHYYHEMLTHPAMLCAERPRRVLVIGGGDGGTVREVLRHPEVEHVTMCELDEQVVRICQEHLTQFGVPWDDPRLNLLFGDGVALLREHAGPPFDVILVDGPDPVGPAAGLFESPFYRSCKAALVPGGVLAVQSESPFRMREEFVRIVKTLRSVFELALPLYVGVPIYPSGQWSFTFASDVAKPLQFDEARAARIADRCKYYNAEIHRAAFAQPTELKRLLG